ncbi:peptidase C14 [Methylobacterium sp. Leaf104]|uniref:caspase family protein n=1 Tax=Methylobacterium TaxID=407 RepID=UPI0006F4FCE6|nr:MULTISPECIES: caspase family protein [Methylobacterium]KQP40064.1 peptidase C14 [Methylobacterium sp. Leaf104]MCI9881948.1 caspase family protein [Methylobacterium goesingense]
MRPEAPVPARQRRFRRLLIAILAQVAPWLVAPGPVRAAPDPAVFSDNADSVAVVIGNRSYKQTVPVDYAHNDAEAMRAYLVQRLGYRESNVFVLKDATLNEFNQVFGTERNPQSGRLWRSVREGRSNVFVYYSGHGVPDLATRQPFLLPEDGNPNQGESGYSLETLYRNLDLVKRKIGSERQLVVMVDACFTGETGRKGESLLAVSAPGFAPARPKSESGIVRLVATSGATPANWDVTNRLGLLTSRFLMGVSGLADGTDQQGDGDGQVAWPELQRYLRREVEEAARRTSGREQVPEIDDAPIVLKAALPVEAIAKGVASVRDEAAWRRAEGLGTREAFEGYVGTCGEVCAYRERAMERLFTDRRRDAATRDQENWARLGPAKRYRDYLEICAEVCAYRGLAEGYLGGTGAGAASGDPNVRRCDELAAGTDDPDRPPGVTGVKLGRIEASAATEACRAASAAHPDLRRLAYQLGRTHDRADRYKDAFAAYERAAKAGSISAMNNLATLYENGQGVKRSQAEAFRLYRQAGEGGNMIALANAARMLEYGNGIPKNEAAAVALYKRAVEGGDVASISKLVPHYTTGAYGFPKDLRQGLDLFRQAADKGDPVAMATMAALIDNGFGRYFPGVSAPGMVLRALKRGELGAASVSATDTGAQKLKPETIRAVQRAIKEADYYSGALDGRFNPVFVRALDLYAKANETE